MNMDEDDFAIADFTRAIALDPNNATAVYMRGIAREKKGYLEQSQADFRLCIEMNVFQADARAAIRRVQAALQSARSSDKGVGEAGLDFLAPEPTAAQKPETAKQAVISAPVPASVQDVGHARSKADSSSSEMPQRGQRGQQVEAAYSRFSVIGILAVLNAFVIWLVARGSRVQFARPEGQ